MFNFDHPGLGPTSYAKYHLNLLHMYFTSFLFSLIYLDAFDHQLMVNCLKDIKECRSTQVPLYDFKTNSRVENEFTTIHPSDVVLLEGILVFYYKEVRDLFDMKLFVDTDADTRLARRGNYLISKC